MSLFLDALNRKNRARPPIWLMRQAGRYLPQYKELKKTRRLFELFHDEEMIVKITRLPIDLLKLDAAILFSDILSVLDGFEIKYDFKEGVGPVILEEPHELVLQDVDTSYKVVSQSIRSLKKELKVPLIGFAGAPFTIATYLIEKGSSKDHKKTKTWMYSDPTGFAAYIEKITDATIAYLQCQQKSGVDAIQVFDSWAGILPMHEFKKYCLAPLKKIISSLEVPAIVFCRGSSFFAETLAEARPAAISLDWNCDMSAMRKKLPGFALQGNLDPMVLYGTKEEIRLATERLLKSMKGDTGFIFNLGHGMLPDMDVEKVKYLIDYVQNR